MKSFYLKPKFFSVIKKYDKNQFVKDVIAGVIIATVLAGIFLILMGVFKMGSLIKFIPHTITTGFTAGIAVTIFIGQIKDFLGLRYADGIKPIETLEKIEANMGAIGTFSWQALLVGAADKILDITFKEYTSCLVLRMRGVTAIDATAMNSLEQLYNKCQSKGITLVLSHVNEQPLHAMQKVGFYEKVGAENFCSHIDDALNRAAEIE